jgi:hypothetical protein
VLARVVVVLDDLSQQQRDALVGGAQLDGLLEAEATLLGEGGDDRREREHGKDGGRLVGRGRGREEADRGRRGVDEPDDAELADVELRPPAGLEPGDHRRHQRIEAELGRGRVYVDPFKHL